MVHIIIRRDCDVNKTPSKSNNKNDFLLHSFDFPIDY